MAIISLGNLQRDALRMCRRRRRQSNMSRNPTHNYATQSRGRDRPDGNCPVIYIDREQLIEGPVAQTISISNNLFSTYEIHFAKVLAIAKTTLGNCGKNNNKNRLMVAPSGRQ